MHDAVAQDWPRCRRLLVFVIRARLCDDERRVRDFATVATTIGMSTWHHRHIPSDMEISFLVSTRIMLPSLHLRGYSRSCCHLGHPQNYRQVEPSHHCKHKFRKPCGPLDLSKAGVDDQPSRVPWDELSQRGTGQGRLCMDRPSLKQPKSPAQESPPRIRCPDCRTCTFLSNTN